MTDREKLLDILMDELPDKHPWEGEVRKLIDRLIANGVTVQQLDGCEYCKADNEGYRKMFGAFYLVNPFHGKGWQIHAEKCKPREIHYCPMCGRKLSEPPKGE